jgi:hypothetical protein
MPPTASTCEYQGLRILLHRHSGNSLPLFFLSFILKLALPKVNQSHFAKEGTMEKGIFISFIFALFTFVALGENIHIQEFSGTYSSPKGKAQAKYFVVPFIDNPQDHQNANFSFELADTILYLESSHDQYRFENIPTKIQRIQNLVWRELNFTMGEKSLSGSLQRASFKSQTRMGSLNTLLLNCSGKTQGHQSLSILERGLINCFQEGFLNLKSFSSRKNSGGSTLRVQNLSLEISNHDFLLIGNVEMDISFDIRAHGKISYRPTEKLIIIKLNKAMASFLNVTDKVFEELEKNQSSKLQVKRPYIYLKNES